MSQDDINPLVMVDRKDLAALNAEVASLRLDKEQLIELCSLAINALPAEFRDGLDAAMAAIEEQAKNKAGAA